MVLRNQKDLRRSKSGKKNDSGKGIQKAISKNSLKKKSKATKDKIDRINANTDLFREVTSSIHQTSRKEKPKQALDPKQLKEDLEKDERNNEKKQLVDTDLTKQLEILTGVALD
ncbi:Piso0_005617 [Millerozyma farinosa CBS 7064]|uniref:Piso0_005617 protein n=1 Tax=Pichia sorbitophila (strain ATCC MYA-4447 / BCRC 22081 / CBS 7064 / NBRC 10061 / NRRL Y-12695) TaxID=559304 RepID=G8XZH1_PICSO|nr:Piso0_005617 [Millerozyma farinosa CBS 7064]